MSRTRHRAGRPLAPQDEHDGPKGQRRTYVDRDGGRRVSADQPSVEKHWLSGCRGKRPFDSERIARREGGLRELECGNPMRPYLCDFCGRWHLTTDHDRVRHARDELGMVIWRLEQHLRERGKMR